jgi:hypothetical protein
LRRTGDRWHLAGAILNIGEALIQIGDWDAAEIEYRRAVDSDGLADMEDLTRERGWLAAATLTSQDSSRAAS